MKNLVMLMAGATSVLFSGLMIWQSSLYVGAICLLGVLLQTAVFFCLFQAPLLGFLQVMVYAGAVMVLIVIAIASSSAREGAETSWSRLSLPRPLAALGIFLPFVQVACLMLRQGGAWEGAVADYSAQSRLGAVLFGPYVVATEAVGLLLFVSALALLNGRK